MIVAPMPGIWRNAMCNERRGARGWFSSLPWVSKWGVINLGLQIGLALLSVFAPNVASAMAGGAALAVGAELLGVDHYLIALPKSSAPGLGAAFG
jgi:hypothetical protein